MHLYALSYVYTFQMRPALWAPTLVVLAWTLQRRVGDFLEQPAAALKTGLLLVPFPLAFLPLCSRDTGVALALAAFNTVLYGLVASRGRYRVIAIQLALASGVAVLACTPTFWTIPTVPSLPPSTGLAEGIVAYVLIASLLSRRPEMGLLGAITAGVALGMMTPAMPFDFHSAFHGALMFLLLHSLRWTEPVEAAARALRWVAAGLWTLHAFVWTATGGPGWQVAGIGTGVLLTWMVVLWMRGVRPPLAVLIAAVLVAISSPVVHGVGWTMTAPTGPLAIAASFVLLVVGTAAALTKHRWHSISAD